MTDTIENHLKESPNKLQFVGSVAQLGVAVVQAVVTGGVGANLRTSRYRYTVHFTTIFHLFSPDYSIVHPVYKCDVVIYAPYDAFFLLRKYTSYDVTPGI